MPNFYIHLFSRYLLFKTRFRTMSRRNNNVVFWGWNWRMPSIHLWRMPVSRIFNFTIHYFSGNGNRFSSKDECLHRCSSRITPKIVQKEPKGMYLFRYNNYIDVLEICSLPFEAGSCSGIEKKWFFDVGTGRCRSFTYSGCEGMFKL